MALKFFDKDTGSGQLPFLKDWLEANKKNKETVFVINEVTLVQSNKGYMVKTDRFSVFLWKNSKQAKQLVEALAYYCENPQSGFAICVVLNSPTSEEYRLAADDEKPVTWFTSGNGYTTTEPVYSLEEESDSSNPLIVLASKQT